MEDDPDLEEFAEIVEELVAFLLEDYEAEGLLGGQATE